MNQIALDFTAPRAAHVKAALDCDEGMKRALAHANSDDPDFSLKAADFLFQYALKNDRFTGWMVTASAKLTKAVEFKSGKAWGSLFVKAQRDGWIIKDGFTADPGRHMNPCPIYKSLIYRCER